MAMSTKPTIDSALKNIHTTSSTYVPHTLRSIVNAHVEGHVVRGAIPVFIRDVMDGTHGQDNLAHCVNNGQVNNSPANEEEERMRGELSTTHDCR